jgi:hypothetical protein
MIVLMGVAELYKGFPMQHIHRGKLILVTPLDSPAWERAKNTPKMVPTINKYWWAGGSEMPLQCIMQELLLLHQQSGSY